MNKRARWPLTAAFPEAFRWADRWHKGQRRKGTAIPYIAHPMSVAALVLEHGGTQAQAVAALLHDVMEDCGVPERDIRKRFGPEVAVLVRECSDAVSKPKPPWEARKRAYIAHLAGARPQTLLISASDKLHNASAINRDLESDGPKVWKRFSAPPARIVWYYQALLKVYKRRAGELSPEFRVLLRDLEAQVRDLTRRAKPGKAAPARTPAQPGLFDR